MAIPKSNLPGHKSLHGRAVAALGRCQEAQDIEFKEAATWGTLKWKIIRTALAMGNLRDGGIIVVGVSERNDEWDLAGITADQKRSYDPDNVMAQTNAYVSPHVAVDVVLLEHDSKQFILIGVNEFRDTPLVCKKNGPDGEGINKGRTYVRPAGKPESTMVRDAADLHDLLELAAEKRARRILAVSKRIGMVEGPPAEPDPDVDALYDAELEGL